MILELEEIKMDITSIPSSALRSNKPVPLPRRTNQNLLTEGRESPQRNSPSPGISSGADSPDINFLNNNSSSKPVPFPRKLVQRLTPTLPQLSFSNFSTSSSQSSPSTSRLTATTPALEEESEEDSLDYESIPGKPSQQVDLKRGTINIFKLANQIDDPFDTDFERSIKEGELLSAISFTSPLADLDEATRRRISTLSSYSSSTSTTNTSDDSSDHYMEPPPARPVSSELAASNLANSFVNKRSSGYGSGNRNSNFPLPIKEENEFENFDDMTSSKSKNKLPLTKVPSCPTAPVTDDTMYEPICSYSSNNSSSSGSRTSSISGVNFISSGFNASPIPNSFESSRFIGNSGCSSRLNYDPSSSSIPMNSNFTQSKRSTVPNIEKLSASPKKDINSSQDSNANLNGKNKFDATAFEISDLLNNSRGIKGSSNVTTTSSSSGSGSNWSLGDGNDLTSTGSGKRRSLASPTESTDSFSSFDRSRVVLRRTASNRSTGNGKKIHEYDDVAIEDGNVILLNHSNSSSESTQQFSSNTNSGSSLTSRNSVIVEFDPLLTNEEFAASFKKHNKPSTSVPSSLPNPKSPTPEEEKISSLNLNDEQQHRYEFIDTDIEEETDRGSSGISNVSSIIDNNFVSYSSIINHGKSSSSSLDRDSGFHLPNSLENPEYYSGSRDTFQNNNLNIQEERLNDLNQEEQYEPVAEPKLQTPSSSSKLESPNVVVITSPPVKPSRKSAPNSSKSSLSPLSEDFASPCNEDNTDGSRTKSEPSLCEGSSSPSGFFRRFSNKFKLNSIKEEITGSGGSSTSSTVSLQTVCKKCHLDHPESVKCKFLPTLRQNVVFSSNLYKPGGLGQKNLVKKRVVLKEGKLAFLNEKSEVNSEIPLEKISVISKKDDQKVNPNLPELKYFEMGLVHWKSTSLLLAGSNELERSQWMRKYVEAHTATIPLSVISNFDRGGWCFMKEAVTSDWRPSWLLIKERSLFYAYQGCAEYYEMDLRKARSIVLSQKEDEHRCPFVQDNQEVLTIDLISKILYVQTEGGKITSGWEKAIKSAASFNGIQLHEMQLTLDNVPVIVDKCIDFLYAHGTLAEGIYRQSGSNTRITQLLSDFQKDSWAVTLSHKEFSAHDVAGTLKRFFRTLPEPLVTSNLYKQWIKATNMTNRQEKLEEYTRMLENLPQINYNIIKKLICHLYAVHELHEKNLMPLINLAPIWGPTLMNVDSSKVAQSYETACAECEVVKDLIENYYRLFRVDPQEIAREKKMQDALENFHLGSCKRKHSGDMKIWIYLWEKDESSAINVTLTPQSTAHTIVNQICSKSQITDVESVSIHEIICQKALERPLHPSEKVIETVLRWSIWEIDERKDNFLILKKNILYPSLHHHAKDPRVVSGELKYADSKSKSFRKYLFTFSQAMLKYSKDSKGTNELGSWKIQDIVWYIGCETKRTTPTKWTFTFVKRNYPFKRGKEEPFFGNVLCCSTEDELQKWIGAMIVGEHPEGLYPSVIV